MTESGAKSPPQSSAAGVTWQLEDLYAAPAALAIAEDQTAALQGVQTLAAEYRGRIDSLDAGALAALLAKLEALLARSQRSQGYSHLAFAADTSQPAHGALVQSTQQQGAEIQREALFFELEWQAVAEERANLLLADPALARYRHWLGNLRRETPYTLSEPEEKVLLTKSLTGSKAFQRLFDQVQGAAVCTVAPPGEAVRTMSLEEALALLFHEQRALRAAAADGVTACVRERQGVLTFIFNTLVQDHGDNDRLRGRNHPMLARNLANEIGQPEVDALLDACDGGMGLVQRYYTLKRRLLGLDTLYDYDRYAPLGSLPACTFPEAQEIVLDAYGAFSPRMAEVAQQFFDKRWIDAQLSPGKMGGAFSASTLPDVHPYILVNYTDNLRDVMTLAHELGHGVHQYLSRGQGLLQMDTPLTMAETASVFGEMLTFRRLMARETEPRARLALLCHKLESVLSTVFRQAAMTRFEQHLHAARREQGELDAPTIGALWQKANQAMFGDSVELRPDYAHWWGYIPHFIHSPFYCYAYSFGELLVLALYRRYEEEGAAFVPRYLELLEAGGSAPPATLLATLGVDISRPEFWQQGIALIATMVEQAEALADQLPDQPHLGLDA